MIITIISINIILRNYDVMKPQNQLIIYTIYSNLDILAGPYGFTD
jgi:hypothetical protein